MLKHVLRATAIIAVAFSSGYAALADDWNNGIPATIPATGGISYQGTTASYSADQSRAVIFDGTSYTDVDASGVNPDGTFKTGAGDPCGAVGAVCSWMKNADIAALGAAYSTTAANPALYTKLGGTVSDAMTGGKISASTDNVTLSNETGASTTVTADGVKTTGTVDAKTVIVNGRDVESSLTAHDAQLANHETRITATNTRLNEFNGTGGSLESWASGVNGQITAMQNDFTAYKAYVGNQVSRLDGRIDKAYAGVAIALAMESPQVDPGKHFGLAINWGEFEGENAGALSAKIRFDHMWSLTAGVGTSTSGTVGARAGLQAQW